MEGYLIFSTASDLLRVHHSSIVCITGDGNYSQLLLIGGEKRTLTIQLGQLEKLIYEQLGRHNRSFVRIGKSLIVNCNFIFYIHIARQQLVLVDSTNGRHILQASKEALRQLKTLIEHEPKGDKR
ncbi:MAG: LytTR family transcriptional regulator [Muribaculaceae bacterium]|nr:LytTR family transcriptional regulator [Muribaculaceae bacterium]